MWGFQTQVLMLVCQALYCRGSSFQSRPGFHYQTYCCCIYPVIIDSVLLLIFKHVNSLNQNVSLSCCSPHSLFVKLKAGLAIWRWFPLQGVSVSLEANISHTTFWVMQMHASCLSHLKSICTCFYPTFCTQCHKLLLLRRLSQGRYVLLSWWNADFPLNLINLHFKRLIRGILKKCSWWDLWHWKESISRIFSDSKAIEFLFYCVLNYVFIHFQSLLLNFVSLEERQACWQSHWSL